jgi:hypothetical protein
MLLFLAFCCSQWRPGEVTQLHWDSVTVNLRKSKSAKNIKAFLFPFFEEYMSMNFDLQKLLPKVDILLTNNSVPYCAAGGTLVGAVRHNAILPFDTDADLQIPIEYYGLFDDKALMRRYGLGSRKTHINVQVGLWHGDTVWEPMGALVDVWPTYKACDDQIGGMLSLQQKQTPDTREVKSLFQGLRPIRKNKNKSTQQLQQVSRYHSFVAYNPTSNSPRLFHKMGKLECIKLAPLADVLASSRTCMGNNSNSKSQDTDSNSNSFSFSFSVRVPRNPTSHLIRHYGSDVLNTVKIWNYDFNNENMDPEFEKHKVRGVWYEACCICV